MNMLDAYMLAKHHMRMKLDDFLTQQSLTEAEFADLVGCSQPHVNRLRHGKMLPKPGLLAKIHQATGGKVTATDWYPDLQRVG